MAVAGQRKVTRGFASNIHHRHARRQPEYTTHLSSFILLRRITFSILIMVYTLSAYHHEVNSGASPGGLHTVPPL